MENPSLRVEQSSEPHTSPEGLSEKTGAVTPAVYGYVYPDGISESGTVERFGTNGRTINGSRPLYAIPYYAHPPVPIGGQISPQADFKSYELGRNLIEQCAKVADDYARDGRLEREYACETADEIASRIRALVPIGEEMEQRKSQIEESRTAESVPLSPAWRTIDGAPRDGTIFLGWSENEVFPAAMCWERPDDDDGSHPGQHREWVYADWMLHNEAGCVNPTHWMPLPKGPS